MILFGCVSCYKKKHNAVQANFILDKTSYLAIDSITVTDNSKGGKIVEYNWGDGNVQKGSQTLIFKHKYSNAGNYTITATAFEHVEGLHPHEAKYNTISKTITVN